MFFVIAVGASVQNLIFHEADMAVHLLLLPKVLHDKIIFDEPRFV